MTISSEIRKIEYNGTGANTALATVFKFVDLDDVEVISKVTATDVETTLVKDTHYTITGGSFATGTVTPIDGATDFPATVTWTLFRRGDRVQPTDYETYTNFPASSHENALDRVTMLQQEAAEDNDRALKLPDTETGSAATSTIPTVTERASKSLGFDASGNPIAISGSVLGTVNVSSFMETVLDDTTAAAARTTLAAQEDVVTTRGDVVRGDSSGDAERLALGASGTVLASDGTDVAWTDPLTLSVPLPQDYMSRTILANDTDTAHDIAISAGAWRDVGDAANIVLSATLTKQIDAAWAAGDDAGGFPTGLTLSNNTLYRVFVIRNPTSGVVDAGFDTDASATNLLADATGYTQYKRVGYVLTDGSANIRGFHDDGHLVLWDDPPLDVDVTEDATANLRTMSGPPDTVLVLNGRVEDAGTAGVYVSSPYANDEAASASAAPLMSLMLDSSGGEGGSMVEVLCDASRQIRTRASAATVPLKLSTIGYYDRRGF